MSYRRKDSRKKQKKKVNYKKISVILSALFMVVTVSSGLFYSQKRNQTVLSSNQVTQKLEKSDTSVSSLFKDEKQIFLKPDVTMAELSQQRVKVDKIENSTEKEQQVQLLEEASDKCYILAALTNLYQDAVSANGTINEHAQLKSGVSAENTKTLKKMVESKQKQDEFYQQVWVLLANK